VRIVGAANLPSDLAHDASAMYANNLAKLLAELIDDGQLKLDMDNQVIADSIVCHDGRIVHPKVRQAMGLAPEEPAEDARPQAADESQPTDASNQGSGG
jgi:NAD(P) transhydrogenase subunit alpha